MHIYKLVNMNMYTYTYNIHLHAEYIEYAYIYCIYPQINQIHILICPKELFNIYINMNNTI